MAWSRPGDKPLYEPTNDGQFIDAYMRRSASMSVKQVMRNLGESLLSLQLT